MGAGNKLSTMATEGTEIILQILRTVNKENNIIIVGKN